MTDDDGMWPYKRVRCGSAPNPLSSGRRIRSICYGGAAARSARPSSRPTHSARLTLHSSVHPSFHSGERFHGPRRSTRRPTDSADRPVRLRRTVVFQQIVPDLSARHESYLDHVTSRQIDVFLASLAGGRDGGGRFRRRKRRRSRWRCNAAADRFASAAGQFFDDGVHVTMTAAINI